MDEETRAGFARMDAGFARMERFFELSQAQFGELGGQIAGIAECLDRVETRKRFQAIDRRLHSIEERFIGVDDQFHTLTIRLERFEQRVDDRLDGVCREVGLLREHTQQIDARTRGIEIGMDALNARVDTLAEDMRQRFRVVNDRLAAVA